MHPPRREGLSGLVPWMLSVSWPGGPAPQRGPLRLISLWGS